MNRFYLAGGTGLVLQIGHNPLLLPVVNEPYLWIASIVDIGCMKLSAFEKQVRAAM